MFDITNAGNFYQKLLDDFDDYIEHPDSARHAINCAITAHHMADWVWGDFIKADAVLRTKYSFKKKEDFMIWIDSRTIWYGVIQSISNGSKHFIRENAKGTHKVEGWGMGGYGEGPYGMSYLAIEVSSSDPKNLAMSSLLEVVVRFWRDFLKLYGPYHPLPRSKTTLLDEM